MKNDQIDKLISQWNRIGTWFNAPTATQTPDLERLVLDTVRSASGNARLFIMAATWLNQYGEFLARHRFKRMITDELETEYRSVMGMLLDIAQQGTHPLRFQTFIDLLRPAGDRPAHPLFDISRSSPGFIERAKRRASPMSKKWGLWADPIEFKFDAIRPASWIRAQNPEFIDRAYFRGDLRASIMAALRYDEGAGDSESNLAIAAGGSRSQVREDLVNLQKIGCAQRIPAGNKIHIALTEPATAA